jgi:hypothetical protein
VIDAGSIVMGWLTKVVVVLSLLGILAFDGIALVTARFSADDHAHMVARSAADTYRTTKSPRQACLTAQTEAAVNLETIDCEDAEAFQVRDDGRVKVTLHKTATTLWMHRIGFLKKHTHVTGTGTGLPSL